MASDIRVLPTHHGGCYDTEGFALLHPRLRATRYARAFDLSGRAVAMAMVDRQTIISRGCVAVAEIISVKSVQSVRDKSSAGDIGRGCAAVF